MSDTLAARLRSRRLGLGLTLAAVADRAKLSVPYIANLERGRGNPTADALKRIAEALEISPASLMGGEGAVEGDPVSRVLESMRTMPASLVAFSKTPRFREKVISLAKDSDVESDELQTRLLVAMASSPRRSKGEPTSEDWNRLLDTYSLILRG